MLLAFRVPLYCYCLVAKLCPTRVPMDCSPPGPSVHGILQARILSASPFTPQGTEPMASCLLHYKQTLYLRSHPWLPIFAQWPLLWTDPNPFPLSILQDSSKTAANDVLIFPLDLCLFLPFLHGSYNMV